MTDRDDLLRRKDEHIDIALAQHQGRGPASAFDALAFAPNALPEVSLAEIDLSATFLGKRLKAPFLISSMTGGPVRGARVNAALAEAAQVLGLALGVGSQRVDLEAGAAAGLDRSLRARAPDVLLLANFGAAQLVKGWGVDEARRLVDAIEADALILHLNPLQEAMQAGGDTDWRGAERAIGALTRTLGRPVVAKEVGFGIGAPAALRLAEAGVAAIDVAGTGGADWAEIEARRSPDPDAPSIARTFAGWGLSTVEALTEVRAALPHLPLIGSGGVRNGLDAAKAIALGADLAGQASAVLGPALEGPEAVIAHFRRMERELRLACFATGSASLSALKAAPLRRRAA